MNECPLKKTTILLKGNESSEATKTFKGEYVSFQGGIDTFLEPQTTSLKWMEMVISNHFLCKDLVHHPIETTLLSMVGLGVPGVFPFVL